MKYNRPLQIIKEKTRNEENRNVITACRICLRPCLRHVSENPSKRCYSEYSIQNVKCMPKKLPDNNQIIMYDTSDGETKVEVLVENETVWFSQKQVEELFDIA